MSSSEEQRQQERERYGELLQELRVVLPGVQVLFAFLLTAPFSSRFADLDQTGLTGYIVALVSAALSSVMFMTPTSYHRIAPRQNRQERLRLGVRVTLAGMAALVVAMAAALFVVSRFVFGGRTAVALAGAVVVAAAVCGTRSPSVDGSPTGIEAIAGKGRGTLDRAGRIRQRERATPTLGPSFFRPACPRGAPE